MSRTKAKTSELEIVNRLGLHARAAARFVKEASQFASDVVLSKEGIDANGKSIMGMLMLAAPKGSKVILTVKGSDQEDAFLALKKLIENGFDED